MRKARQKQALDAVYRPRPAKNTFPIGVPRELLFDFAATHIGDVPILYLEFGVFDGASLRAMVSRFTHPQSKFFGFDSFVGLPEDWLQLKAGAFSQKGNPPNIADSRVSFVKGWFQNTLPPFLARQVFEPDVPVFVNFDADVYSATLFVLCQLWEKLSRYYFYFDEFTFDEVVALHDFSTAFPVETEFLACTHFPGPPAQVFGEMKRVEFTPPQ
jgi:hypothetical protein